MFQMGRRMRGSGVFVGRAWLRSVAHIKLTHTHTKIALGQLPASAVTPVLSANLKYIVCMAGEPVKQSKLAWGM